MCADHSDRYSGYSGTGSYRKNSRTNTYPDNSGPYRRNSQNSGGGGRNQPNEGRRAEGTRCWYSNGRDQGQGSKYEHKRFKADPLSDEYPSRPQTASQNGWAPNKQQHGASGSSGGGGGGGYGRSGHYQSERNPSYYQNGSYFHPDASGIAAGRNSASNHYDQRFNHGQGRKQFRNDDYELRGAQNHTNFNLMKKPPKIYQRPKPPQQEQPHSETRSKGTGADDWGYVESAQQSFANDGVAVASGTNVDTLGRQHRQEKRGLFGKGAANDDQFNNDKSKKKPRRKPFRGPPPEDQVDLVVHHLILFFANELSNYGTCSVEDLLETHRANSAPHRALKQVVKSDSQKVGIHAFLLQHPTIFTVLDFGARVQLTAMNEELDEQLASTVQQRLVDYFRLWISDFGKVSVHVPKLFRKLQHTSVEIDQNIRYGCEFVRFLGEHPEQFVLDEEKKYVALKEVADEYKAKNKPLPRSDEITIDQEILDLTEIICDTDQTIKIIDEILSQENPLVAVDLEGVNLGAPKGYITLIQVAVQFAQRQKVTIYLFDLVANNQLIEELRRLFNDKRCRKVLHGCKNDLSALKTNHNIKVRNIFDTYVASRFLNIPCKQNIHALFELFTGAETNRLKDKIKKFYYTDAALWAKRPFLDLFVYYAALDAFSLLKTYFALQEKIDKEKLAQLEEEMDNEIKH